MRTRLQFALAALGVAALAPSALAQGATVGGQLEVNYTYNFNKPNTRNNTYLFNSKDSSFSVNVGELNVTKEAEADKGGYVLRLITGRIQEAIDAKYGTGHVLEAYGTVKKSLGSKDATIDFGQFAAPVGIEGVTVGTSQFFTRSFSRQYLQPFLLSGIKATIPLGDKDNLGLLLANRFDGVNDDTNRDLAFGARLHRELSESTNLVLNLLTARENIGTVAAPVNRATSLANLVYTNKLSESTSVALDATLRSGKDAANRNYSVTGFTGYLHKTLGNENVLGLRAEYLKQNNATSAVLPQYATDPSRKPTMTSITASYELKGAFPGARTLLEFRADRAGGAIFPGEKAGTVKKDQTSVTFGQVFKF